MTFIDYNIFENHFKTIFPELFFLIAITILLLYGVIYSPMKEYGFPILTRTIGWLAVQTLVIVLLLIANQTIPGSTCVVFNNVLIFDDFTTIIKTIVLLSALFSIVISFDYIKNQKGKLNSFEYVILILIATLSMLFLISSYDLISLYLAIELQSLAFYVLAAFQRSNEFSTEAGLKYFILGALSSGFLLFGESIIYGFTGITNFEELTKAFAFNSLSSPSGYADYSTLLAQFGENDPTTQAFGALTEYHSIFSSTNAILIGLLFMLVAFLFKIGAVPFHMWTPDVYEGAPTSVTAFFSITPKIAVLALLLRLCLYTFYDLVDWWQPIMVICAILSMYIGTFGAINQNKIKRLFAYSSIAHVGYMLIGLATGTIEAVESLLLYIIIYIVMVVNIFGVLLIMTKEDSSINSYYIRNASHLPSHRNFSERGIHHIQQSSFHNNRLSYIYKFANTGETFNISSSAPSEVINSRHLLHLSNPLWNKFNFSFDDTTTRPFSGQQNTLLNSIDSLTRLKKKEDHVKYITDLASLSKTNPTLAVTLAVVFFSNAGVPPLAGFYGKLNVFLAAVEGSMYFLAFAAIICSVIGAFYSIRLIKIIYYHNISTSWLKWTHYKPISKETSFVLAITFFFTSFFFLYPSFLWTLTHSAALSLCL